MILNERPKTDAVILKIAEYAKNYKPTSEKALKTAAYCLMDTLGCGFQALEFPACTKLLGPAVEGTIVPNGAKVPGTHYILDPMNAAFNLGCMIRWLDFNDTWLAAEWGHPSDNLGAILAVADFLGRQKRKNFTVQDILEAMIKAHEIQGILALENSFNKVGLDHVLLVKVASTAIVTQMMDGSLEQIADAVSHAWLDGQSLRTYRHSPNTGSRKSWAAGDACRRAVQLATMVMKGEMGYPTALTAKTWGFYDVLFKGKSFTLKQEFASYVMENILFKISFPAEFHAQTAVECAVKLHSQIIKRLDDVQEIQITTHESALRIISKYGPLHNPADRDHCIQYMTAIGLLFGHLEAKHYEDDIAADLRIDILREKMLIIENKAYSKDYLNPEKRSIANAVKILFNDGSSTEKIEVQYPIGHPRRREEAIPVLMKKFQNNLNRIFDASQVENILNICADRKELGQMDINDFVDFFIL